jgi:hypothetical protein
MTWPSLAARRNSPGALVRLCVPKLLVGVLPDAAGVEHHDIGLAHVVGLPHAVGHEHAGQALGVVLVHLAPECADDKALGH